MASSSGNFSKLMWVFGHDPILVVLDLSAEGNNPSHQTTHVLLIDLV